MKKAIQLFAVAITIILIAISFSAPLIFVSLNAPPRKTTVSIVPQASQTLNPSVTPYRSPSPYPRGREYVIAGGVYITQAGDTLSQIADDLCGGWQNWIMLARDNGLKDDGGSILHGGIPLKITCRR